MLIHSNARRVTLEDEAAVLDLLSRRDLGSAAPPAWGRLLPAVWGWVRRAPDCEVWGTEAPDGRLDSLVVLRRTAQRVGQEDRSWSEVALVVQGARSTAATWGPAVADRQREWRQAGERDLAYTCVGAPAWPDLELALELEVVRRETRLEWTVENSTPQATEDDELVLRPLRDRGREIRELSERVAANTAACSMRDAALVRWRFAEHPLHRHKSLAVRWHGQLIGYLIFRERAQQLELVDWQVPDWEEQAGAALIAALGRAAVQLGAERVTAFLPEWSPWFERFQAHGFRVSGTDRLHAAQRHSSRWDTYWLRDGWFLQPGDFALG